MQEIESEKNPKIQFLVKLRQKRYREKEQKFLVEGSREISRALKCGFVPVQFFAFKKGVQEEDLNLIESLANKNALGYWVSEKAYEKMAVRESTESLIGVFQIKPSTLEDIPVKKNSTLIALENLEKPGNLGALLRTADGSGVEGVILLGNSVDKYNPNAIRSSLGAVFNIPVVSCSYEEFFSYSHSKKFKMVIATPNAAPYYQFSYLENTIFCFGNEAKGVSSILLDKADIKVGIPMKGVADSLNVSVSAAVLLYEAFRQKH